MNDLVGMTFGRLTVTELVPGRASNGSALWSCRCECGGVKVVSARDLTAGVRGNGVGRGVKSCGCLLLESAAAMGRGTRTHGETVGPGNPKTPEYAAWISMKSRCSNRSNPQWKDWGGRGIRVCDRWQASFEDFLSDVGRRPGPLYSLDRIDNDGDYEPGNVRWATAQEQQQNRAVKRGQSPRYVFHLIDTLLDAGNIDAPAIDWGRIAVPSDVRTYLEARRST